MAPKKKNTWGLSKEVGGPMVLAIGGVVLMLLLLYFVPSILPQAKTQLAFDSPEATETTLAPATFVCRCGCEYADATACTTNPGNSQTSCPDSNYDFDESDQASCEANDGTDCSGYVYAFGVWASVTGQLTSCDRTAIISPTPSSSSSPSPTTSPTSSPSSTPVSSPSATSYSDSGNFLYRLFN